MLRETYVIGNDWTISDWIEFFQFLTKRFDVLLVFHVLPFKDVILLYVGNSEIEWWK